MHTSLPRGKLAEMRSRQSYAEACFSILGRDLDLTGMRFDDRLDDSQAEPRPFAASLARRIHAIKAIEQMGQMFGWNADTGIAYFNPDPPLVLRQAHMDGLTVLCISDGVGDQIAQCAAQHLPIAVDLVSLTSQFEPHTAVLRPGFEVVEQATYFRIQIDSGCVATHRALLRLGQEQHVADHRAHMLELFEVVASRDVV